MDDTAATIYRNRWTIAAIGGVVAFLLFWFQIGWGFFGALACGLIVFVLLLVLIGMIGADEARGGGASRGAGHPVSYERGAGATPGSTAGTPGGSTVPPSVAGGGGASGGSATAATAPVVTGTPVGEGAAEEPRPETAPAGPPPTSARAEPTPAPPGDIRGADPEPASPQVPVATTAPDTDPGRKPATLDAPRDGRADDLKKIKGIGPKLEALCNRLGFWHFDQIAGWSDAEVDWVDQHLEGFKGRVRRDDWVAQARQLAAGGGAGG